MLSTGVPSLLVGRDKNTQSDGDTEGSPALGIPRNRGNSLHHLQVRDAYRVSNLGASSCPLRGDRDPRGVKWENALLCGISHHPRSRLGQRSGQQPFSFGLLAKAAATTRQCLLRVRGRSGQGGQGPPASPTQFLHRGHPFPSGTLCQNRETPAPGPRSLILKVSLWPSLLSLCAIPGKDSAACEHLCQRRQRRPRDTGTRCPLIEYRASPGPG